MGFKITCFIQLLIWELKVRLLQYQEVVIETWRSLVSSEFKCPKAFDFKAVPCSKLTTVFDAALAQPRCEQLGSKAIYIFYYFFPVVLIYPLLIISVPGVLPKACFYAALDWSSFPVSFALGMWKGLAGRRWRLAVLCSSCWLHMPCESPAISVLVQGGGEDLGAGEAVPPAWRSSGPALNGRWGFKSLTFLGPEKLT